MNNRQMDRLTMAVLGIGSFLGSVAMGIMFVDSFYTASPFIIRVNAPNPPPQQQISHGVDCQCFECVRTRLDKDE